MVLSRPDLLACRTEGPTSRDFDHYFTAFNWDIACSVNIS